MRKWTAFYCHCWRAHSLFLFFFSKSLSKTAIVLRCWPRARVLAVAPGNQNFHQSDPVFFHIDVGQWEQNSLLNLVIMSRRPQTPCLCSSVTWTHCHVLKIFEKFQCILGLVRNSLMTRSPQTWSFTLTRTDVRWSTRRDTSLHSRMSWCRSWHWPEIHWWRFHGSCDVGGDSWVGLCGLCGLAIDLGFIANVTQFYSKLLYFNANS